MDSSATEIDTPFWLKDNFAPIPGEVENASPEVIGTLPTDLNGRYLRIGPNPMNGPTGHWFLGDGMVHGIELQGGQVNWVKSKLVQTPMLNKDSSEDYFTNAMMSLDNSVANTHIIHHAGKILALEELHYPYEVTPELETVGAHNYDGKLNTGMTAHPKICGKTGEMLFFAYGMLQPPYLTYHRVSAAGELLQTEEIDVGAATMMHDFNVTENYVVFMDLPLTFDLAKVSEGGIPLAWREEYGARLGVMPRTGGNADVVWYEIDPCYVFHPLNAYEEDGNIIIDACRFDHYLKPNAPSTPARLTRWNIDTKAGRVDENVLLDLAVEFPRVPDKLVGQKHRYGYMTHLDDGAPVGIGIIKYDFEANRHSEFTLPEGQYCGEPVFSPRDSATTEDDGYLMTYLYDRPSNKSQFIVLDAQNVEVGPIARVKFNHRIPYGFHGSWIAD